MAKTWVWAIELGRLTVVYDSCVLYSAPLRDLLVRVAGTGLFQARWSAKIHDEWTSSLINARPDLSPAKIQRTRDLLDCSIADCLVTGYEPLVDAIALPDPDDRHVVAAAVRSKATTIVTINLRDFPKAALQGFGIVAQHPDDYLMHQLSFAQNAVLSAVRLHRASLRRPPQSVDEYLSTLARVG